MLIIRSSMFESNYTSWNRNTPETVVPLVICSVPLSHGLCLAKCQKVHPVKGPSNSKAFIAPWVWFKPYRNSDQRRHKKPSTESHWHILASSLSTYMQGNLMRAAVFVPQLRSSLSTFSSPTVPSISNPTMLGQWTHQQEDASIRVKKIIL